ncbi:MAG: hypothetical protein ABFC91_05750 [Methanobacteriaceae archaeon]
MEPKLSKYITEREEEFSARKYYSAIFHASLNQSTPAPEDDTILDPETEESGYYSPEIYRDQEEYYGSHQNQSEDDALILFTTSFIEEEVIKNCINQIDPNYLRSKEWEMRWLAAKVRFRV